MSDDEIIICCILGLCCAPAEQETELAKYLANHAASDVETMRPPAKAILDKFDLLPHGSLKEYQRIARQAGKR